MVDLGEPCTATAPCTLPNIYCTYPKCAKGKAEAEAKMFGKKAYDDTDPVMAALQTLAEDGYATDPQRRTAEAAMREIEKLRLAVRAD